MRTKQWIVGFFILISICSLLTGCTPPPPRNVDNICDIFDEYPRWYWTAKKVQRQWGVPVNVQMAIIHQESKFNGKAKPNRTKLLWVIPWKRPSSAYGYSQALEATWHDYQIKANKVGSRDEFASACDFIGWYAYQAYQRAHINRHNAYDLYLAYHEGIGGYEKKTYLKKQWLINVSHKVSRRAQKYQVQLKTCEKRFKKKWWNFV